MSEARVIYIDATEADLMQLYLDSGGEADFKSCYWQQDKVGNVQSYGATFEDDVEVSIHVVQGIEPFVGASLYDANSEVGRQLIVKDELLGEYKFFYNGKIYTVLIEVGREQIV